MGKAAQFKRRRFDLARSHAVCCMWHGARCTFAHGCHVSLSHMCDDRAACQPKVHGVSWYLYSVATVRHACPGPAGSVLSESSTSAAWLKSHDGGTRPRAINLAAHAAVPVAPAVDRISLTAADPCRNTACDESRAWHRGARMIGHTVGMTAVRRQRRTEGVRWTECARIEGRVLTLKLEAIDTMSCSLWDILQYYTYTLNTHARTHARTHTYFMVL
jgi:hypothetical protein